ncbi:hypothetical protein SEA_CLOWN_80 [Gordonia phage Clown]|uniref:Uncharacterized protein n=1 Tax=Gordonia phage Clown TaxID=2759393 RepID=A0A7L7SLM8_9CAUD|nr:secreted protein [Gordonia phage Clown]QOC56078.1 hypothetical protein SEA_CLOWN_80 [Gordonia phage Clown]
MTTPEPRRRLVDEDIGFNSWDTWKSLKEGKTYDIKTGGYRIGLFSAFPAVLEIKETS